MKHENLIRTFVKTVNKPPPGLNAPTTQRWRELITNMCIGDLIVAELQATPAPTPERTEELSDLLDKINTLMQDSENRWKPFEIRAPIN